jgi:hypothetical protein
VRGTDHANSGGLPKERVYSLIAKTGFLAHIAQRFTSIGVCQRVRVICEASQFEAQFTLCEEANDERSFRKKGSQEVWPRFEALAKRASAIRTHSSVLIEYRRRVQRIAPWWYSSDCTRFFEAEITWSTVKRLTDNDMIEQVDLQKPGSFG